MMRPSLLIALAGALTSASAMPFRVAQIFAPNAVLQRNEPIAVWGWASPGAFVTAALFNADLGNITVWGNGTTGSDGLWTATFPPQVAASNWELFVTLEEADAATLEKCRTFAYYCTAPSFTVQPIHTGDVILCIGQSNMQVRGSPRPHTLGRNNINSNPLPPRR
jgi:sialate O-acetylesterase